MHLLSGNIETEEATAPSAEACPTSTEAQTQRMEKLEADVVSLQNELDTLRAEFAAFKKQFE